MAKIPNPKRSIDICILQRRKEETFMRNVQLKCIRYKIYLDMKNPLFQNFNLEYTN